MTGGRFSALKVTTCGISALSVYREAGVTHVLSLLDPEASSPQCLETLTPHCRLELRFHDAIMPEPGVILPAPEHVEQLLRFGREALASVRGAHLLIHCHAGVSRSTAAAILCLTQAYPTRSAYDTLGDVVRLQPAAWPNLRLLELGDEALGRHGELIAAAGALYRRTLDANPRLGDHLRLQGRNREVILADRWR